MTTINWQMYVDDCLTQYRYSTVNYQMEPVQPGLYQYSSRKYNQRLGKKVRDARIIDWFIPSSIQLTWLTRQNSVLFCYKLTGIAPIQYESWIGLLLVELNNEFPIATWSSSTIFNFDLISSILCCRFQWISTILSVGCGSYLYTVQTQ